MASTRERRTNAGSRMEVLVQAEKPRAKRSHDEMLRGLRRMRDAIYELPPDAMDVDEGSPAPHASDEEDPMLEITQEQFDRYEDDDAYLSEPEFEKPAPKGKSVVAGVKGSSVRESWRLAERLRVRATHGEEEGGQRDDRGEEERLSKTWIAKASAGPSLGGLTDEDVVAARPELQDTVKVPRGPRKNDVSTVHTYFPHTHSLTLGQSRWWGWSTPPRTRKKTPTNRAGQGNLPIKAAARTRTSVKLEAGRPKIPRTHRSGPDIQDPQDQERVIVELIHTWLCRRRQRFARFHARTWSTRFLPEVHKMLYRSTNPMLFGAIGDNPDDPGRELVTMLKELLDRLYPGIDWPLEWGRCHLLEGNRIGDPSFGNRQLGVQVVDAVFEDVKYYGDKNSDTPRLRLSTLIANDAKIRSSKERPRLPQKSHPTGRLFAGSPRILNTLGSDVVQKPAGYLESPAVVKQSRQSSATKNGRSSVSYEKDGREVVERGFKLHASGIRSRPSDFSAANYGTAVNGFIASIKNFRASRWESIFAACGAAAQVQAEEEEEDPRSPSMVFASLCTPPAVARVGSTIKIFSSFQYLESLSAARAQKPSSVTPRILSFA
ncbi:hypothetical protein B0H14DRAFT_3128301 [Mycena olivaceomarginata]|nr:hypothetical protein B0H14DRAFT_3128301 [Mycena olivaceomarginata]